MVIYISTPAQLQAINNNLSESYELTNDIDMKGFTFTPIGSSKNQFKGTLDGKGHKIKNLRIQTTVNDTGLFSYIYGATIKNVGLENASVLSTAHWSGIIAGTSTVNSTIENCWSTGEVSGNYMVGGIVGRYGSGLVKNCYSHAKITGIGRLGGLVGYIETANAKVENCYSTGSVENKNLSGGLIGDNVDSTLSNITNSFWDIETSGFNISKGGTGLTTSQFADSSNFPTFDSTIWGFSDYPYLKVFGVPSLPAQVVEITLNSHLNAISNSLDVSKRKMVVTVSSTQDIQSRVSKQLIKNVTSTVEQILSSIEVKENANIKSYTVNSELIPFDSSVTTSKKVVKVLTSLLEPIQSIVEVIIPIDLEKPIYANVYAITNNTNTYTLQNPTNTYQIENHTELEVI